MKRAILVAAVAVLLAVPLLAYDLQLYDELIFNAHDGPRYEVSWVLPWPDPQFYLHLGGPNGCRPRRVTRDTESMWKAVIPVVATQATGEHYRLPVRSGCRPRERAYKWVIVSHVTPAEYERETGRDWGNAGARATAGSTYGRIWVGYDGRKNPGPRAAEQAAHELGHVFGLFHTGRRLTMLSGWYRHDSFFRLLMGVEQQVARQAYKMGRYSRCDICPGEFILPPLYREAPIIKD